MGTVVTYNSAKIDALEALAVPTFVKASANQTVVSSTAIVNDTQLALPVLADSIYEVTLHLFYEALAAADFKLGWSAPAGAVLDWGVSGLSASAATGEHDIDRTLRDISGNAIIGGIGIGSPLIARIDGVLTIAATPGTFTFMFAQGTSNATGSIRRAGSLLKLRKLD